MKVRSRKRQALYSANTKKRGKPTKAKRLKGPNPLKADPTRTATMRRVFLQKLRAKMSRIKMRIFDLLVKDDALGLKSREPGQGVFNAFCPGEGARDNSCSPKGGNGGIDVKVRVDRSQLIKSPRLYRGSDSDSPMTGGNQSDLGTWFFDDETSASSYGKVHEVKPVSSILDLTSEYGRRLYDEVDKKVRSRRYDIEDNAEADYDAGRISKEEMKAIKSQVRGPIERDIQVSLSRAGVNGVKKTDHTYAVFNHKGLTSNTLLENREGPFEFSSTQFDLPEGSVSGLIFQEAARIPDEELAKHGRETDPHVTVKYGLHADDAERVRQVVSGFGPVKIKLGPLSLFPANEGQAQRGSDMYDVLKVDVEGDDLYRLNKLLSGSLKHTDTHPVYRPHITVAYLRPGEGRKYVGSWQGEGAELTFDRLTFSDKVGNKTLIELGPTANVSWSHLPVADRIARFESWLRETLHEELLSDENLDVWAEYIRQGYARGAGRAFDDTAQARMKAGKAGPKGRPVRVSDPASFYQGSREQFLKDSFAQRAQRERLESLVKRAMVDLEGMTEEMSTKTLRALSEGLVTGAAPDEVARQITESVDGISRVRAESIARTELIRAHSEGQLDALENLGVEEVGVMVEWIVTPDEKVCPKCEAMEGVVLKIEEARGLIPRHPHCRCSWTPANVGEDEDDQVRGAKSIERAVRASAEDDDEFTIDLDPVRPHSILNQRTDPRPVLLADWEYEAMALVDNMFSSINNAEEGDWITIKGTHVQIGEDGEIVKGPGALKELSKKEKKGRDPSRVSSEVLESVGAKVKESLAKLKDALDKTGSHRSFSEESLDRMVESAKDTTKLYGQANDHPLVIRYTNDAPITYTNVFTGEPTEEGKILQDIVTSNSLPQDETLYRGLEGPYIDSLRSLSVGEEMTVGAKFCSTSRSSDVANIFGKYQMRISAKQGSPGVFVEARASEILLPANARFRVTGSGPNHVEVEYLGV